jgi:hypothetical protein
LTARDDDIPTVTGQVVAVQIMVVCQCGNLTHHVVDCTDDDGFWTAPMQDRFHLCESCAQVIDAGLKITVNEP